jgi:outer membrane protein assembly factor BamA
MKIQIISLALFLSTAFSCSKAVAQAAGKAPQPRVGQVFIIGNEFTRQSVILDQVQVYPGEILNDRELSESQKKLERLGIFKPGSVTVTAEDDPVNPNSEYKNVFVRIEEMNTRRVRWMSGVSAQGEPVASLVWEERNFDPFRLPFSKDDLMSGNAFRGGGQLFRLDLIQFPLVPCRGPRFLQTRSVLAPIGDSGDTGKK